MWNLLVYRVDGIWCIYSLGKECCVVFAVSPIKKCVNMCIYMCGTTTWHVCVYFSKQNFKQNISQGLHLKTQSYLCETGMRNE